MYFVVQASPLVSRGAIKDFNLPDRVSGALKILPDISKIYRTFPKSWHIYLVAYNFFMNHPCDIIQTLNNINVSEWSSIPDDGMSIPKQCHHLVQALFIG